MPFRLLDLVVVFVFQVLFVFLYLGRHFVELKIVGFPIVDYSDYVLQRRPEVRVWSQHVPHQILHLLRAASWVPHGCIHDAQLAFLLERVISIVHDEKDAAEHPYVHPLIHWVLQIHVDHFRGPVHESCVFLKSLLMSVDLGFGDSCQVNFLSGTTPKITQLSNSLFGQQNVFHFYILMQDPNFMHFLKAKCGVFQDLQNLKFA